MLQEQADSVESEESFAKAQQDGPPPSHVSRRLPQSAPSARIKWRRAASSRHETFSVKSRQLQPSAAKQVMMSQLSAGRSLIATFIRSLLHCPRLDDNELLSYRVSVQALWTDLALGLGAGKMNSPGSSSNASPIKAGVAGKEAFRLPGVPAIPAVQPSPGPPLKAAVAAKQQKGWIGKLLRRK